MAQLIVRRVDEGLVRRLKVKAHKAGVSMEEQHRRLLRAALQADPVVSLHNYLLEMPDLGEDIDFERTAALPRSTEL